MIEKNIIVYLIKHVPFYPVESLKCAFVILTIVSQDMPSSYGNMSRNVILGQIIRKSLLSILKCANYAVPLIVREPHPKFL